MITWNILSGIVSLGSSVHALDSDVFPLRTTSANDQTLYRENLKTVAEGNDTPTKCSVEKEQIRSNRKSVVSVQNLGFISASCNFDVEGQSRPRVISFSIWTKTEATVFHSLDRLQRTGTNVVSGTWPPEEDQGQPTDKMPNCDLLVGLCQQPFDHVRTVSADAEEADLQSRQGQGHGHRERNGQVSDQLSTGQQILRK